MGSQNTLTRHCAAVGAHHQLGVGKAVEVTEAVQQSHLHSFSKKSLELWVSSYLGQPRKAKSRERAKPQPSFGIFPESPDHLLVVCWDLHNA